MTELACRPPLAKVSVYRGIYQALHCAQCLVGCVVCLYIVVGQGILCSISVHVYISRAADGPNPKDMGWNIDVGLGSIMHQVPIDYVTIYRQQFH